jgi:DNA helicase-2/ATP-dependent DNA helicase PcrA
MSDVTAQETVDQQIYECLDFDKPKSFFLFAGAGSGKTRTLVEVLTRFRSENIDRLRSSGRKVAIITYTNAACEEIQRRLDFDVAFHVSTIHSFAWELINPYATDIRDCIAESLKTDIADLEEKQGKAKNQNTKTYKDRESKIASKTKRLDNLPNIRKFSYNPNGDNLGTDSLSHAEVITIASNLLKHRPLMQQILIRKYPVLLIDESQDTKKDLMEAFLLVQEAQADCFTLGMFGDTMQRIYADGKPDLGEDVPEAWEKPAKTINYRCPRRVIELINKIRSDVDGQEQEAAKEDLGTVRLFIVDASDSSSKSATEAAVVAAMASASGDPKWEPSLRSVKILTLEHHMAANRGGFSRFFAPLHSFDRFRTGLLDGTLSGVPLFAKQILPLVDAMKAGDKFAATRVARNSSPMLSKESLKGCKNSIDQIRSANAAVEALCSLWKDSNDPSLSDILKNVFQSGLFKVPDSLRPIAERLSQAEELEPDDDENQDRAIAAWEQALESPFSHFVEYVRYISDESQFGTHQGIKGLQFPRVMVILDDEEARGFLFSYEKLFGAKDLSDRDQSNLAEGKETTVDRSKRLFYVTCSRAEESLAIVCYTTSPERVAHHVKEQGWFEGSEIVILEGKNSA